MNDQKMKAALKTLEDNKADLDAWRMKASEAQDAGLPLPAPPATIATAIGTIGTTLGNAAVGVGSTAADAVSVAGVTVDALHGGVNDFFSNLRKRLGV